MRVLGRYGAGLAGIGVFAVCCALGPAAVLAGVGAAATGLGLGAWIAVTAGALVAGVGVVLVIAHRRKGPPACADRSLADRSSATDR